MTSGSPILNRFVKDLHTGKTLDELMHEYGLNREELDEVLAVLNNPEMMSMRHLMGRIDLTESQIGRAFVDLEELLNRRSREA
jgi:hypothetical protein